MNPTNHTSNAYSGVAPALLTCEETARVVAVSTRTLWRLLSAGKLPKPVRVGGSTRWRRSEIEAWIAEGCPAPNGDQQ